MIFYDLYDYFYKKLLVRSGWNKPHRKIFRNYQDIVYVQYHMCIYLLFLIFYLFILNFILFFMFYFLFYFIFKHVKFLFVKFYKFPKRVTVLAQAKLTKSPILLFLGKRVEHFQDDFIPRVREPLQG